MLQEILEPLQEAELELLDMMYGKVTFLANNAKIDKSIGLLQLYEWCGLHNSISIGRYNDDTVEVLNYANSFSFTFRPKYPLWDFHKEATLESGLVCYKVIFTPFSFKLSGFTLVLGFLKKFSEDENTITKIENIRQEWFSMLTARDPHFVIHTMRGIRTDSVGATWRDDIVRGGKVLGEYADARDKLKLSLNNIITGEPI